MNESVYAHSKMLHSKAKILHEKMFWKKRIYKTYVTLMLHQLLRTKGLHLVMILYLLLWKSH